MRNTERRRFFCPAVSIAARQASQHDNADGRLDLAEISGPAQSFPAKSAKSAVPNTEQTLLGNESATPSSDVVHCDNATAEPPLQIFVLQLWHSDRHLAWGRVRTSIISNRHPLQAWEIMSIAQHFDFLWTRDRPS